MTDFFIKSGDTSPALAATLTDSNDEPIDLTGADVMFYMRPKGSETVTVESSAVVEDSTAGEVAYEWDETDTESPGTYRGEFEVTYGDGEVETFPNDEYITISISEDIA